MWHIRETEQINKNVIIYSLFLQICFIKIFWLCSIFHKVYLDRHFQFVGNGISGKRLRTFCLTLSKNIIETLKLCKRKCYFCWPVLCKYTLFESQALLCHMTSLHFYKTAVNIYYNLLIKKGIHIQFHN